MEKANITYNRRFCNLWLLMIGQYVDEEHLRNTNKDFGLVTVSILEFKPYELMLEDIPQGQLANYLMNRKPS